MTTISTKDDKNTNLRKVSLATTGQEKVITMTRKEMMPKKPEGVLIEIARATANVAPKDKHK
jgi:hypothetical protein